MMLQNSKNILLEGNYKPVGNLEIRKNATGIMRNNVCNVRYHATYEHLASKGGSVIYYGNINPSDYRGSRPNVNTSWLGSTNSGMPTVGKFNKGDIIWNGNPSAGGVIGWVCVTSGEFGSGTDPVFKPFGDIGS